MRRRRSDARAAWLFLLPFIIGFVTFLLLPLIASFVLIFFRYDGLSAPQFVAFRNVTLMLTSPQFWDAWRITAIYGGIGLVYTVTVALGIALALFHARHFKGFWRVLFFLPAVIAGSGEALMLKQVWGQFGFVNSLLSIFGVTGPSWFNDSNAALPALIVARYWTIGATILFFLGARSGVNQELYEAAAVDGATPWRSFRSITLPMMTPMILFNLVLGAIFALQAFAQIYILTRGGPARATEVIGMLIYDEAFGRLHIGYAAALSWTLLLVTLVVTAMLLLSGRKWVYYESGERGM